MSLKRPSLLRAVKSAVVLARAGSILRGSAGSEESYRLSSAVPALNTFISHNWATHRVPKFMAIALFFNFFPMVIAMVTTSLATFAIMVAGIIDSEYYIDNDGLLWSKSTHCSIVGSISALLALFLWHEVNASVGCPGGYDVFLDKTCIHQTDNQLMREGIESLGAFVLRSKWMLVVYSDVYLQKLWTVYELGTYLCFHPPRHLVIMPLLFPIVFLLVHLFVTLYAVVDNIYQAYFLSVDAGVGERLPPRLVMIFLCVLCGGTVLRAWSRSRESLVLRVGSFNIRSAACAVESDRARIEMNVADMMRGRGVVDEDAGDDIALDAFDTMVQSDLPKILKDSFDAVCSYKYCAFMSVGILLRGLDTTAVHCIRGEPAYRTVAWFVHYSSLSLLIMPLLLALLFHCTSRLAMLRGCIENVYIFVLSLMITVITMIVWFAHYQLCVMVEDSRGGPLSLGLVVIVSCILVLVVWYTFKPPRRTAERMRPSLVHRTSVGSDHIVHQLPAQVTLSRETRETCTNTTSTIEEEVEEVEEEDEIVPSHQHNVPLPSGKCVAPWVGGIPITFRKLQEQELKGGEDRAVGPHLPDAASGDRTPDSGYGCGWSEASSISRGSNLSPRRDGPFCDDVICGDRAKPSTPTPPWLAQPTCGLFEACGRPCAASDSRQDDPELGGHTV